MNTKTLETIKSKLLAEKESLEKDLATFATKADEPDNYNSQFPQYGSDEGENAAEVAAYGDRLSMEQALEEQLSDISKALQRIEDGTYGMCQYCKQPLEDQRLEVRPTSSSCVECKKKLKGEN